MGAQTTSRAMDGAAALATSAFGASVQRELGKLVSRKLTGSTQRNDYKHRYPKGANKSSSRIALSKRHQDSYSVATRSGNELTTLNLTLIDQGSDINNRERQVIYVRGVRFTWFVKNTVAKPMFANWALIELKYTNGLPSLSEMKSEFFRGHFSVRASDFDSVGTAIRKHNYGINTDKYIVHAQGKFTLAPNTSTGFQSGTANNWKKVEEYVKINKKIKYDDATDTAVNPLYFVSWVNPWDTESLLPTAGQQTTAFDSTVYFQECI